MNRYVIGPDTALRLAAQEAVVPTGKKLLAPTLLRSQVLAQLYGEVQRGLIGRKAATARLDYLRGLQIRLLGDRVLQAVAWQVAEKLGWPDTFVAEYIALTKLQADALVVEDMAMAKIARSVVPVVTMKELLL
jgi:predicted nucleic acid-binding protein